MMFRMILNHSLRFYNFLCRVALRGRRILMNLLELQFLQVLSPTVLLADRNDLVRLKIALLALSGALDLIL